ncbi:MAG: GTPase HflX [Hyphomicrobiales bacterium]|nr:GTPase HflX [Hyphomicrobiales bacterium]MDE2016889.1 GTPase HflX [Hyphomicrobiales bacterium]
MTPTGGDDARERAVASSTRAFVVGPYLARGDDNPRTSAARLEEAAGLARAIDLDVVEEIVAPLSELRPATYLGKGKVEEIAVRAKEAEVGLVTMDCALSPVQQRNLEKAFGAKVIDRTGLILEIFGRRARTREGALQVELAHLAYQKSRLVRSWTHLERQRGGFGFLGGPGESQIETDRRLISERIVRLTRELEDVKRTRALHRKPRRDAPFPVVALVGYTNAGKSTLFNALTGASALARDMLFATLDPTLRRMRLPHGGTIILSDTVGFVSDLPTMLVSAFRATLEEVTAADVILHVRDMAHADGAAQADDVRKILAELGIGENDPRMVEVWNKADLLDGEAAARLAERAASLADEGGGAVLVSAATGAGLDALRARIERRLAVGRVTLDVEVAATDGAGRPWLHENAEVLAVGAPDDSGARRFTVRVAPEAAERVKKRFGA